MGNIGESKAQIRWFAKPVDRHVSAARDYLTLLVAAADVELLKAIRDGRRLSPVLAVRGNLRLAAPLTLADGYHRLSACALIDEDSEVMCRVVALGDDA